MRALIVEAIELIQSEHDVMVRDYTVRACGDAARGRVVDKTAKRDIDRMAQWLARARRAAGEPA